MSDTERSSSARAIHELASSRRPLSNASPARLNTDTGSTSSSFNLAPDDVLMSTHHNLDDDSHILPKLRSTAQKYGFYNPPEPQPHVPTSAVNRAFQDFDHSNATDEEDSRSVEIGRGLGRTPSRPSRLDALADSDILLDMGNSFYDITGTPPPRPRTTPKSNLRREAQLRRASSNKPSLASGYAKVSAKDGSNVPSQRPEETTTNPRSTRFGRNVSGSDGENVAATAAGTPQRAFGTPRSTANATAQSFMLPDLPNLTELVSGTYKDGTPVFSRSGKARSRFSTVSSARRPAPNQPNFARVTGIPIPEEEKAILASLQLLKDKVAQLEQEKAEADHKIEDYEVEVLELRSQLEAQSNFRRSDSALGSTDEEAGGNKRTNWQIEKTQLEASVQSLQKRLERSDRKVSVAEIATKRITQERDSLVTQLGVAFYNSEELKTDNETLRNENRLLQDQVADLQSENHELTAENEELRAQLDKSHDRHEEDTQRWAKKETALNRKATTTDRAIFQENQTLRDELAQMRLQQEEDARQAARKEAKARREAEKAARAEHANLANENEQLKEELEQAKATREGELKRWAGKQAELQAHIERKEETIHQLQAMTPQDEINEQLRQQNEELKVQLARIKAEGAAEQQGTPKVDLRRQLAEAAAQREDETQRWSRKEARMREQLDKAREVNDLNRQLSALRDDARSTRTGTEVRSKRRSAGQIGTTIHDSVSEQVEREVQRVRSTNVAQPSAKPRSRSKSQSRRQSRPEPPRNYRHSSAPVRAIAQEIEDESDVSTTDLSFDPAVIAGTTRTNQRFTSSTPLHTGDTTFLTFIDGDVIANLRKQIEEERVAARKRGAVSAPEVLETDEPTSHSRVSHKSSRKDLTSRSRASHGAPSVVDDAESQFGSGVSDNENPTGRSVKQDTVRSNISHTSRRHRRNSSAFTEMTSAFILPDITLHTRPSVDATKNILNGIAPHDSKNCSVCKRIISSAAAGTDDINAPTPIPVSTRPEVQGDIDATLRPTQPPVQALALVLKQLNDELLHLKLEFTVLEQQLRSTDPSLGRRARKAVHEKVDTLNKAIETKSDQIYTLYDVVEAHKAEIQNAGEDDDLPEEVEMTLESIRVERTGGTKELSKAGRKVAFGVSGRPVDLESVGESEAPWAGISDTEGF